LGEASRIYAAARQIIESGAADRVPDVFATDCVIMDNGEEGRGVKAVQDGVRAYAKSFADSRHEVLRAVESPNMIAVEVVVKHKNIGPLQVGGREIPATGKEMVEEAVDFVVIEAGKIKYWRVYEDRVNFLRQLELVPESLR
jgi:ketosteroid isomerase-like protein